MPSAAEYRAMWSKNASASVRLVSAGLALVQSQSCSKTVTPPSRRYFMTPCQNSGSMTTLFEKSYRPWYGLVSSIHRAWVTSGLPNSFRKAASPSGNSVFSASYTEVPWSRASHLPSGPLGYHQLSSCMYPMGIFWAAHSSRTASRVPA